MSGNNLEEILKVVENVKHKKMEGTLYLMSERIAWMPKQKDTFLVSHQYVDIKTQKISTEGKSKIQLQVVLHDESSSTFHFVSPAGAAQQLRDRDQVKDLLTNLLPKFKQKISQELEEKKKILMNNPQVYQLYNDLVVGKIISAQDFWKNYVDFSEFKQQPKDQLTGVSQGFMANITPKPDSGGLVYNLTYDDIQSVFKTYPTVRQKYVANVPHKISEKEFWTKFFQSYYFRRDLINTTSNDLFDDCTAKDEEDLKAKTERTLTDPMIVFGSNKDLPIEDGFGLNDFLPSKTMHNLSSHNLIKRYNYYSMRVLNSMDEIGQQKEGTSGKSQIPTTISTTKPAKDDVTLAQMKKTLLNEELEDLINEQNVSSSNHPRGATLNLTHVDRYFLGPRANEIQTDKVSQILQSKNQRLVAESALNQMNEWNLNVEALSDVALSMKVLKQMTPGSELMKTNPMQDLKALYDFEDEIPKGKQEEIKTLYVSSAEMLRHFHACFPPKNAELEAKLDMMKEALETFYQQKIMSFHAQLIKENFPWNVTSHLESMFKIAFAKYNNWKSKQKQ